VRVVPDNLLVGWCGTPGASAFGRMTGDLQAAADGLLAQAEEFDAKRPKRPVVELIATVAHDTPGTDGLYRSRTGDDTIEQYLVHARKINGLLLLNIQPGHADFLTEVQAYQRWLAEPDVGVALDPEWALQPPDVPGTTFGTTTGSELDTISDYLAGLVSEYRLPQKVMVYHQVASSVVTDEDDLRHRDGVAAVKSVDGIGDPGLKRATWKQLMADKPEHVQPGFKLFYEEDTRHGALMRPDEVLALRPTPTYVMYE
jgi:hypothetical protein